MQKCRIFFPCDSLRKKCITKLSSNFEYKSSYLLGQNWTQFLNTGSTLTASLVFYSLITEQVKRDKSQLKSSFYNSVSRVPRDFYRKESLKRLGIQLYSSRYEIALD